MPHYATATDCVPEPCSVAGTPLRPFCLGHHLLFKRLALPFADNPDAPFDRPCLLIGVAICAQSYEQTMDQMLRYEWDAKVSAWQKELRGPWWKRRKTNWTEAESLFRAYLDDGYKAPPIMRHKESGSGIRITAPWECSLKVRLTMSGMSESEVFNRYLPAAWYDYYTLAEIEQLERCNDPLKWKQVFYVERN